MQSQTPGTLSTPPSDSARTRDISPAAGQDTESPIDSIRFALSGLVLSLPFLQRQIAESRTNAIAAELILRRRAMTPGQRDAGVLAVVADDLAEYTDKLKGALVALGAPV